MVLAIPSFWSAAGVGGRYKPRRADLYHPRAGRRDLEDKSSTSKASPACYTRSLTCLTVLGGVSGRVQLPMAWPGHGVAHKYLFD